ncbi:MAG: L-alanine-DL-glutamate epimerase [Armatimonadota bacterium]|nr:L-alanine-DL-glutamate epimerase [Armatimonadota bacterium]
MPITIAKTNSAYEREPLLAPFGFKGGSLTELWQTIGHLESANGNTGLGLGTQSVLWSDANVFTSRSETDGNRLMYDTTAHALWALIGFKFDNPIDLIDPLVEETYDFARHISGVDDLRLTFALNALVAVDNAVWQLYCAENGITSFDDMVPAEFRPALPLRHDKLVNSALMTYGTPLDEVVRTVKDGCFLIKVKLGADPDKDGDREKMLEWDKQRLSSIHDKVKDLETPYTENGRIAYYLDANGRYDGKDRLMRLLDHAAEIGALDRIAIFEEPFPEDLELDVKDIPVRMAADESAHSDEDALERIQTGYRAIALKPIAKTMSMSLKIAKVARENDVPVFCADLTVNPVLADWNKNVAARLAPLPGVKIGMVEVNGPQNYRNWETMKSYHPCRDARWIDSERAIFHLGDDFYAQSGGILKQSKHYRELLKADS